MTDVILHAKRDYSLLRRHPWIFSGAVDKLNGEAKAGETVRVVSAEGETLGFGAYSPDSQIRVRMWTFATGDVPDASFITSRIGASIGRRAVFFADDATNAFRLVNAEADGVPGCVIDKYGDWAVCSFTSAGAEFWKKDIVAAIQKFLPGCKGVYERSDADVRQREGLAPVTGELAGLPPPSRIEIHENGCKYLVDIREGHKTGFYLDQRDNRAIIRPYANGCEMLNAFSYTGGFGISALTAGAASVTHVDLSEPALKLAKENTDLNSFCACGESTFLNGNVFEVLRKFRDEGRSFDMVVLDPPKFATSKGSLMKASRGYKDINLLGIKLLRPGGVLATFSCSELMTPDLFRKVVTDAALDAKRDLQIVARLQQAADHPEGLYFPEGFYLKGFLCRAF